MLSENSLEHVIEIKDEKLELCEGGIRNSAKWTKDEAVDTCVSSCSVDPDDVVLLCRVCHCTESDLQGNIALGYLGILPPNQMKDEETSGKDDTNSKDCYKSHGFEELVSPAGETLLCRADEESVFSCTEDTLINIGCSCKNELSLAHYSCALKWFINHESTTCEICGDIAKNVKISDYKLVLASLKDYETLREKTIRGEISRLHVSTNMNIDLDAIAGIRRQRLSEISLWFRPSNCYATVSPGRVEVVPVSSNDVPTQPDLERERVTNTWCLEGTGVFVAIGLITIVLVWLIAPHVGKKSAVIGLDLLLGCLCALTAIIFLRFVIPRVDYGPLRHWVVLFTFSFLAFGVWASRTHGIRSS